MKDVLRHPFFSGKQVARMQGRLRSSFRCVVAVFWLRLCYSSYPFSSFFQGDKALYDVFLSYRVWCDAPFVEALYALLTAAGLRVYWDKECLEGGKPWEKGFCNGLVNSRAFVPVLSSRALGSTASLKSDSRCDNVILEHRLALELRELVSSISLLCFFSFARFPP